MNENPQIVSQFINAAKRAGASVEIIQSTPENLYNALQVVVSDSKSILLSELQYISQSLFKLFKDNVAHILTPNANQLGSADIGITDAFAGVARTGSVCVVVDNSFGNYISLLPNKHVVILEAKNIVARPRDIFTRFIEKKSGEQRGWIFITGPSATADMGELVRGAHGPSELHIILLD